MKTVLLTIAEDAPLARVSTSDVWRAGRRKRRRDGAVTAVTVIAVVCVLLIPFIRTGSTAPAGAGEISVPTSLTTPYFWQRTFAEAPNGPALALMSPTLKDTSLFGHRPDELAGNLLKSTSGVVIGRDGSFRLRPWRGGILSPDGLYLAEPGQVLDLTTGKTSLLPVVEVLAWSRDSSSLLVRTADAALVTWQVATEKAQILVKTGKVSAAAFSPDGSRIAYQLDLGPGQDRLVVADADGGEQLSAELNRNVNLAGPAAWAPDGKNVALVELLPGAEWRILSADTTSAGLRTSSLGSLPSRDIRQVIGWRGNRPVLTLATREHGEVSVGVLVGDGQLNVLMNTDGGYLQLPQNLVEQASFTGPSLVPSPFDLATWTYWVMSAMLLTVLLLIILLWKASRRRKRRALPPRSPHPLRQPRLGTQAEGHPR